MLQFAATVQSLAEDIHHAINAVRSRAGHSSLVWDERLSRAARLHSQAMAKHEFFSHHSPLEGLESAVQRARSVGADVEAIGENIAMLDPRRADVAAFVDGWLASPGHRDNLLAAHWERSGVGIAADARGNVFATHLFATTPDMVLDEPVLTIRRAVWYTVRASLRVGRGHTLAAFVRNRFVAAADADPQGVATVEAEVPAAPGRHHVDFGRRRTSRHGESWIGVYEGTAEIRSGGEGIWHCGTSAHSDCDVVTEALYRVEGPVLELRLCGSARKTSLCVVDGALHRELSAGERFDLLLEFRSGGGVNTIELGSRRGGDSYTARHRLRVDTTAMTLVIE